MAHITLISQWFPPEPAYLWKDLALGLKEKGHNVYVVTAFPNYPYGKIYEGYKQSIFSEEIMDGIKIIRLPVYPNHSKSIIKRGLSYISFSFSLLLIGVLKIPKSDIFLAYSPPLTVGLCVALIALIKRTSFIINIQDIWPDTLVSSGMIREGYLTRFIAYIANGIYRKSSAVIVLSEGFRRKLIKENKLIKDKVYAISNWSLESVIKNIPKEEKLRLKERLNLDKHDFVITFAGNIGPSQGLITLVKAAELTRENKRIKYLLVGDGLDIEPLQEYAKNSKLDNIIFTGRVAYNSVANYYAISDALLIHLKRDRLFEITIPHKLITYILTGKPIIAAINGEVNEIVQRGKLGVTCDSEDEVQLAKCIEKVASLSEQERNIIHNNAMNYYRSNLKKEVLINKWHDVIAKIVVDT